MGHGVTDGGWRPGPVLTLSLRPGTGQSFPVVITDLGMPYVDGQSLQRVKTAAPATIVIMLTAGASDGRRWGRSASNVDRV